MKLKVCITTALTISLACGTLAAKKYTLQSPDKSTVITVDDSRQLTWSVTHDGDTMLSPSRIALNLADGTSLGTSPKIKKTVNTLVNARQDSPFYKKSTVDNRFNSLTLITRQGYSVEFRAYDEGAAYRFVTDMPGEITVESETAEFNFPGDYRAFIAYINDNRGGDPYSYSFESYYDETPISEMYADSLAITPLLVEMPHGRKVAVMDAGVRAYPGMFLKANPARPGCLVGAFAPEIIDGKWGGYQDMNWIATRRADYIAHTDGSRAFPWRALVISDNDAQLLDNDMARQLAEPACIDADWVKPGKVAWDWWNTTNLTGVDFRAGMNTETYKYFIDFASANGIEYIIIDAGWSGSSEEWSGETLMECIPEIDLEQIIAHGNDKGVGVILWASWRLTDKEKDIAFPHYAKMGVKGFKVDFLDRDDKGMIDSMWEIVKTAADHHLLIDLHGMKPSGIQVTYPNVVNFEGVKGLENTKWAGMDGDLSRDDFLRYDVTIPFIRQLAGPMDYTPGAMTNAAKHYFRPINDHPMSQGTRVHQMAMYTVYEAPLQMLADSPTAYMRNQECTDFIASVPTVFDQTVALDGKVGEYAAVARRSGDNWFVGAMTNWDPRLLTIDLSFLPDGAEYEAVVYMDGVNADRDGTDYRKAVMRVDRDSRIPAKLYPGGGWTARLTPITCSQAK